MKSLEQQQLYENEKQELRNSLISDLEKDKIKYQCQIELNLNKLYSDKCSKIEEEYSNKLETFINQHKLDILNEPIIIEKMKELENEFQIKIDNINKELESNNNKRIIEFEKSLICKYENIYLEKNNELEVKFFRRLADKILELETQYKNMKNLI